MGADRAKHASEAFDDVLRRGFGTQLGPTQQNAQAASGKAEAEVAWAVCVPDRVRKNLGVS